MVSILSLTVVFGYAEGDENLVKATLSGHIHDKSTGEDLIGATVYVKEIKSGTTSNLYGFYSISLNPGQYSVVYSYVGYVTEERVST